MSKKIVFTIIAALALILIGIILFFSGQTSEEKVETGDVVSFPSPEDSGPEVILLESKSSEPIDARMFIRQPTAELLGDGFYRINNEADNFGFYYDQKSRSGMVLLFEKPLRVTRLRAEEFVRDILEGSLSMTEQEICDLNIKVLTNEMVDIAYSGFNLGFSFCPNAVELP